MAPTQWPIQAVIGKLGEHVEIWFGVLSRKALRGANSRGTEKLRSVIQSISERTGKTAKPAVWRKRDVKGGSQLGKTTVSLCNQVLAACLRNR